MLADFGWTAGFGGGLSPDTFPHLSTFPFLLSLQLPELFCNCLNFFLSPPRGGFRYLPLQGLGHGGVGAAQAGGADGPPWPQTVGAGVALMAAEERGFGKCLFVCWILESTFGRREGGQQVCITLLCLNHSWIMVAGNLYTPSFVHAFQDL